MLLRPSRSILGAALTGALLAGCNGMVPSALGLWSMSKSSNGSDLRSQSSWLRSGATEGDLLYVTSQTNNVVYMFGYPRLRLAGLLGRYRWRQLIAPCSDAKGNVFVPLLYQQKVLEFSHGGTKPIAVLKLPGSYPYSCAFDPTTGNLAVAGGLYGTTIGVAIFAHEKGRPTTYNDPYVSNAPYCGYDDQGNLFLDGQGVSQNFGFSELPKGAKSFSGITVNQTITIAGTVQWDGKYVTVFQGGSGSGIIYRLQISGSSATVVGTTSLNGASGATGSWIVGRQVVVADQPHDAVRLYPYPGGGNFLKSQTIVGASYVTVSLSPNR